MAVYSMVAYERVFFCRTYRVNYVVNYFCFNLAKLILIKLKKKKIFEFSIQKCGLF